MRLTKTQFIGGVLLLIGLTFYWQFDFLFKTYDPQASPPEGVLSYMDLSSSQWKMQQEALPPIAVLGDTQQTSWVERFILQREYNQNETRQLLRFLAEEKVGMLVLLGDLVFEGASSSEWQEFDEIMRPLQGRSIPVLTVVGNHDYGFLGSADLSLQQVAWRFPQIARKTWFARVYGNLGLVFLDSNQSQLSASQWEEQRAWFSEKLGQFDQSHEVTAVLVFCHHPPFTNNTRTPDETHIQQAFVPAFLASSKTVALLSGHAHGYERFRKEGKLFLVSGGGGGPRVRYRAQDQKQHMDLYDQNGVHPRPFHYLSISQDSSGLDFAVRGFEKRENQLRTLERFHVKWPASP